MSLEAHPNINAVELTIDILQSIDKHLRGKGPNIKNEITGDKIINNLLVGFIVDVSTHIDELVEGKR